MLKSIKTETLQNAVSESANGTSLDVKSENTVVVEITGTFTADVYFEVSPFGTNWYSIAGINVETGEQADYVSSTGLYAVPVAGVFYFRARVVWTSGTSVTVKATAIDQSFNDFISTLAITNRLGSNTDAVVDAGATGSVSAKLRRISSDIDSLKNQIDKLTFTGDDLNTNGTFSGTVGNVTIQDSSENEYDTSNPFPVAQYGRSVVEARPRAIYDTGVTISLDIPENAKSCMIMMKIYAVTGTTPTIKLSTGPEPTISNTRPLELSSAVANTQGEIIQIWQQGGINAGDIAVTSEVLEYKTAGILFGTKLEISYPLTGTFGAGEGFDMEIEVIYNV